MVEQMAERDAKDAKNTEEGVEVEVAAVLAGSSNEAPRGLGRPRLITRRPKIKHLVA